MKIFYGYGPGGGGLLTTFTPEKKKKKGLCPPRQHIGTNSWKGGPYGVTQWEVRYLRCKDSYVNFRKKLRK